MLVHVADISGVETGMTLRVDGLMVTGRPGSAATYLSDTDRRKAVARTTVVRGGVHVR